MPVSEAESTPKRRTRKPVGEAEVDSVSQSERTAEQRIGDLIDEVREHRASVDVFTEDMAKRLEDVEKLVGLIKVESSKDAGGQFSKLNESILRLTERAELRDQRFDALLAVLAFCDRVPRRRFDLLLTELRKLTEKPEQAAVSSGTTLPVWVVSVAWVVGTLVVCLAFFGVFALVGLVF